MARVKPAPAAVVASLEDADRVLARLAEIKREVASANNRMNAEIDRAKLKAKTIVLGYTAEIKGLEAALTTFGAAKKDELFAKPKSRTLLHGVLGFRKASPLKTLKGVTWEKVLERLKAMGAKLIEKGQPLCIRTKEEVDRETLRTLPEDLRLEAGVEIKEEDEFFYALKEEDAGKAA